MGLYRCRLMVVVALVAAEVAILGPLGGVRTSYQQALI